MDGAVTASSPAARPASHLPLPLLLTMGALIAFGPMSIDMYLPALPRMARELGSTPAAAQLTVAAFFTGLALGQLVYGPLSDRIGRRKPVLAGIVLFLAATVGCALAPTMEALIGWRFVQALGGCAGMVVSRAIVRDRCDHQESARIFSILMLIMGVAPILAPLIGGYIQLVGGWRAIFWVLFGFGALTGLAVLRLAPESRSEETAARARSETPLAAYLALLGNRSVMGYVLVGGLASSAMFTYIAASPELLIETYGVRDVHFGWIFGLNAAGIIGASQLNRWLLKRFRADAVLQAALAVAAVAALLLAASAWTGAGGLVGLLVPLFFAVAVHGLGSPNAMAGAMAMDPHRAGSLSALIGCVQFGLGAAAAGLVGAFHDGTARPMATIILVCLASSLVIFRTMARPKAR